MGKVIEEYEFTGVIEIQQRMKDYYLLKIVIPADVSRKMQHLLHRKVHVHVKVIK